jgi:hypothetical protein
MIEFVAAGSPRAVSRAIEDYAVEQRTVRALVVPWESDRAALSMSVTSVSGDGWAIEHTNLGTIRLIDLGNDRTRVSATSATVTDPDPQKQVAVFDRFAQQLHHRFRVAT